MILLAWPFGVVELYHSHKFFFFSLKGWRSQAASLKSRGKLSFLVELELLPSYFPITHPHLPTSTYHSCYSEKPRRDPLSDYSEELLALPDY